MEFGRTLPVVPFGHGPRDAEGSQAPGRRGRRKMTAGSMGRPVALSLEERSEQRRNVAPADDIVLWERCPWRDYGLDL